MRHKLNVQLAIGLILCLLLANVFPAFAASVTPFDSAEEIRTALVEAQLKLATDPSVALALASEAEASYTATLAPGIGAAAPEAHGRALSAFVRLGESARTADAVAFAAARGQAWTAILAGSEQVVEAALHNNDTATARTWLPLREYRTATRYSRARADATLAVDQFAAGQMAADDAVLTVRADLFGTYQARLDEALRDLVKADQNSFAVRRAELAALAAGYFEILAPAYAEQRGTDALATASDAFSGLGSAALGSDGMAATLDTVNGVLDGFRAAPLSPAEQARRAGQLMRFIGLISVEYGRGVSDGKVIHDFEIQEAVTFHEAAYAAFADLRDQLPSGVVAQSTAVFDHIGAQLAAASPSVAADPSDIKDATKDLASMLQDSMPAEWLAGSAQGDFDVIASMLDQVESAVRGGDYAMAESARLEAYAIMETGPEARLIVLAPQMAPEIENLFWNNQGTYKGLAYLIANQATLSEVQASRAQLDGLLAEAEELVGRESSPVAVATNAGVIVFREGMEAVIILAALMSSMRRSEEQRYRKPMWAGTALALVATIGIWLLAHEVLQSLARYGERLEAVVSLIAVAVLLVIMNWFLHKIYWTSWIASFHSRKRRLISGEAGLILGLVALGFASVFREGFEVVLFLQALVLESGTAVVLAGTAVGLLLVVLLGVLTFKLQVRLPYKTMLVVTGVLIGLVLLQITGKTVYTMQVVGWMPIHPIHQITIPYWWGTWFGIYPTWEGLALQFAAAGFVIGSYFLAERKQKGKRHRTAPSASGAA
ncbi:MAG: FTR1 family protein [Caldilineae bacterium]|nr:FTR1 family protein [Anaerolineae bacterium]MCB9152755.1 FTR1 family protein [Caldilineae bacterium]